MGLEYKIPANNMFIKEIKDACLNPDHGVF